VKKMADAEAEGVREAGFEVDMYQYVPPSQSLSVVYSIGYLRRLNESILSSSLLSR